MKNEVLYECNRAVENKHNNNLKNQWPASFNTLLLHVNCHIQYVYHT